MKKEHLPMNTYGNDDWQSLARTSHKISRQVEQDVALDCSKNARKHCQIDKARGFLKQDSAADCSNWPRICEKYGLAPEPPLPAHSSSHPIKSPIWHRFWCNPLGKLGVMLLLPILILIAFGPFISGYSYDALHLMQKNQSPSSQFWFGTDDLGRDLFTRICYGARISLTVGLLAALIDLVMGLIWGGVAGLSGGRVDEGLMRFADILYSLPYLLIVILLTVVLGSGLSSLLIAITLTGWITMARIVRGQIFLLKEMDYVMAAKSMGASFSRLLFVHLFPNAMGPILITLTLTIPSAIFSEAFLSFLGLGIQAPQASWGTMANEGLPALQFYPWRLFFPAFFITQTMLAFHLIGEGLKFAFNQAEGVELL